MGIRQYRLGKQHGLAGIRAFAHRRCASYDSKSAQQSYLNGYRAGAEQRHQKSGKVVLDKVLQRAKVEA